MSYVYLLYEYNEYGPEEVAATLDRSALLELIDINWPLDRGSASENQQVADWRDCARSRLANVLAHTDAELVNAGDGWDLSHGWGGMTLHVIELYDKSRLLESSRCL